MPFESVAAAKGVQVPDFYELVMRCGDKLPQVHKAIATFRPIVMVTNSFFSRRV